MVGILNILPIFLFSKVIQMNKVKTYSLLFLISIFAVFFSFLFNSCNLADHKNENCNMGDSLITDIPVNRTDTNTIQIRDKIERLAGLTKIDTGFNGLQIRVWYAYSSNVEHLILLTRTENNWSGTLNTLKYSYDENNGSLVSINRISKNVFPKSGWKAFGDSIISMGILELPDMSAINGYELGTDGNWFTVDFANCRKYRYSAYQSPWYYADKFLQARRVVNISNLIENELDFKRFSNGQK